MRHRPQILILAGAMALSAVAAPLIGSRAAATDRVVVVRIGETLSEIALQEGVSVQQLVELNDLPDPNRIFAGQRLRVHSERPPNRPAAPRRSAETHRVSFGETLTGIAVLYRTTVAAIAQANDIGDVSFIRAGQVLRVPGGVQARRDRGRSATPKFATHRVGYGDTLSGIAARYRTSVSAIARANGIHNVSFIRAGQVLRVPGSAGGSRSSTPTAGSRVGSPTSAMTAEMAAVVAARLDVGHLIVAEARRQGVPEAFALAVAWQESGWQAGVVSYAGAVGVMQLLPATGEWVGGAMLGHPVNLWDARQNVKAGVRLLKHYLARYEGNRSLVLAAYYQGQTAADRYGVYPISQPYIASILQLERIFAH